MWAGVSDYEPINFDKIIVAILKVIQRWLIVSVRNQFCRNAFTAPASNIMSLPDVVPVAILKDTCVGKDAFEGTVVWLENMSTPSLLNILPREILAVIWKMKNTNLLARFVCWVLYDWLLLLELCKCTLKSLIEEIVIVSFCQKP